MTYLEEKATYLSKAFVTPLPMAVHVVRGRQQRFIWLPASFPCCEVTGARQVR
ncbi:hypothetical protein AOLI_G00331320 [Acnodon oligacanthus]